MLTSVQYVSDHIWQLAVKRSETFILVVVVIVVVVLVITFAKEVMFLLDFVCLSVCLSVSQQDNS